MAWERKTALNPHEGRYTVTARLFSKIDDLSHEKQFTLYQQLVSDNIRGELFKLIIDMSEDDKFRLLEQLEENSSTDEPLNTLNSIGDNSFMRENVRKICLIAVKCIVADHEVTGCIMDISTEGVFIESNDQFPVGREITLAFKLPDDDKTVQINGHIARSDAGGIGVKFDKLSSSHKDRIRRFIENKK